MSVSIQGDFDGRCKRPFPGGACRCQRSVKTSHFKESKTAPLDPGELGSMGHVECPQSEPANNDLQPSRSWMVAATNCERVGDQSRNGTPVSAAGKTSHFDCRRWGWAQESVRKLG